MCLTLKVECYAGYKGDERPLRFTPAGPKAERREVKQILDQWYGPGYLCFRVRADDSNVYVLHHEETSDLWTLDSFRRARA